MYKVKRPFYYNGDTQRGNVNGMVGQGDSVRVSPSVAERFISKGLVYATKENKKAYIVHLAGSWYEVRHGETAQKVQGKANAEALRDDINS